MKGFLLLAIPLSMALAGCLSSDDAESSASPTTSSNTSGNNMGGMDGTTMPGEKKMYTVATDVSTQPETYFRFRPASFTAKVGDPLNITLKAAVGTQYPHSLVISEISLKLGPLNSGQSASKVMVLEKAGTFTFFCDQSNHRALGMTGTLSVS